ncbi:hypothetical protein HPB51_026575 [Rhipicephalus microplus]|uniref:TRAF-type domain-containing protein n=1 Tax=Rhipicephalus microplus TaxID=6941 RepID=A0A9J6D2N7_RHIMP|nr:hypothetical protein HPB51_026575 [Rhipicephalus microplus]
MEVMLRHYEHECTFHTVECFRCDEQVLHSELPAHYSAGCSAAVSLACPKNTSSDSQVFTIQDVMGVLVEMKTLLRGANQEPLLPAMHSQVNELTERIRNLESRSAAIPQAIAATATSDFTQVAAPSPSASQKKKTSRQTATEEAGASSTSGPAREKTRSLHSWRPLWTCDEKFWKPCEKQLHKIILGMSLLISLRRLNII